MFRTLLVGYVWLASSVTMASESSTISPGMELVMAKNILQEYGYKYGGQYGLAMTAGDRAHALEFVRIDSMTTLVIGYSPNTGTIVSLAVEIIPEHVPKAYRRQISLNVLAISFDDDGIYTLRMKRSPAPHAPRK